LELGLCVGLGLQMGAAHAVSDADDGPGHLCPLDIDQVEEVARVIEPASCGIVSTNSFDS
jgi:hypothetical protein